MKIKNIISVTAGLAMAVTIALPAFAESNRNPSSFRDDDQQERGWEGKGKSMLAPGHMPEKPGVGNWNGTSTRPIEMRPVVSGIVMAVNGNVITLNVHQGLSSTTATTTFTVDATSAIVRKNNATSTVSSIAVGDRISVLGTVNGTNVVAKTIIDGMMGRSDDQGKNFNKNDNYQGGRDKDTNSSSTFERQYQHGFFGGIGQFFKRMFGF